VTAHLIDSADTLREHYRSPSPAVVAKNRPKVDPAAAEFISLSPLVIVATTSPTGTDASPRGGPPGFVKVLDDTHVAFADLAGNNRLDSYTNIVAHPQVGLLFLLPGTDDTLRLNGTATVTTDPSVLDGTAIDGTRPKVAIVVEVAECFVHCAKALRRSAVWDPSTWSSPDARPTAGGIIADQFDLDVDAATIDAQLEAGYEQTLWVEGGR
jgi:PPOX class probable FMN-dependent enzyme